MTRKEQKGFVRELMDNIKRDLLSKSHKWPDNWDGHELRQLIADTAQECVIGDTMKKTGRRYKEYRNHCLTENLP